MTEDSENPVRVDVDCQVRPCVIEKGLDNCGSCEQYPCKVLEPKIVDYQRVIERYGGPIPEEDYEIFVKPYESRKVLDEIRQKS